MSEISNYIKRFSRRDPLLNLVNLYGNKHTDAELAELADCLLAHPDVVTHVSLGHNRLTDETGVKLARYLAASSTIQWLSLSNNQFGSATYLALAAALRVNSSLRWLYLYGNLAVDQIRTDTAFVEALRLNPDRSARSMWCMFSYSNDFKRLKDAAEKSTSPSMLEFLLCAHIN